MSAPPMAVYRAWTETFDRWFATPGAIRMDPRVGEPYWFEVVHEGVHHPHYGRFVALEPGVLIEQTWVTGRGGTEGAETVVRVELTRLNREPISCSPTAGSSTTPRCSGTPTRGRPSSPVSTTH